MTQTSAAEHRSFGQELQAEGAIVTDTSSVGDGERPCFTNLLRHLSKFLCSGLQLSLDVLKQQPWKLVHQAPNTGGILQANTFTNITRRRTTTLYRKNYSNTILPIPMGTRMGFSRGLEGVSRWSCSWLSSLPLGKKRKRLGMQGTIFSGEWNLKNGRDLKYGDKTFMLGLPVLRCYLDE